MDATSTVPNSYEKEVLRIEYIELTLIHNMHVRVYNVCSSAQHSSEANGRSRETKLINKMKRSHAPM